MTEETWEFVFPNPKDRVGSTEVTSLPDVRRSMPNIIVGEGFVGVSHMVGPTPETQELIMKLKEKNEKSK